MNRSEALTWCVDELTVWPERYKPLSNPPEGWLWIYQDSHGVVLHCVTDEYSDITIGEWIDHKAAYLRTVRTGLPPLGWNKGQDTVEVSTEIPKAADGWTANEGMIPVGCDVLVDMIMRDGSKNKGAAAHFSWSLTNIDSLRGVDIVQWRLAVEAPVATKFSELTHTEAGVLDTLIGRLVRFEGFIESFECILLPDKALCTVINCRGEVYHGCAGDFRVELVDLMAYKEGHWTPYVQTEAPVKVNMENYNAK